jgi:formylmethanofuran dehydrogenase subunit A
MVYFHLLEHNDMKNTNIQITFRIDNAIYDILKTPTETPMHNAQWRLTITMLLLLNKPNWSLFTTYINNISHTSCPVTSNHLMNSTSLITITHKTHDRQQVLVAPISQMSTQDIIQNVYIQIF